jgi:hypothetical protein
MGQVRKPEHPLNVMLRPAPSLPLRFARGSQAFFTPCHKCQTLEAKQSQHFRRRTARSHMRAFAAEKKKGSWGAPDEIMSWLAVVLLDMSVLIAIEVCG